MYDLVIIGAGPAGLTAAYELSDSEKKVIGLRYILTNFKLYEAPLTTDKDNFIRENQYSVFFLHQKNWI